MSVMDCGDSVVVGGEAPTKDKVSYYTLPQNTTVHLVWLVATWIYSVA